jgi:FkbM family methyltransferase
MRTNEKDGDRTEQVSEIRVSRGYLELEEVLRRIEAEPLEACRGRERRAFTEIAGDAKERLVLFGAGHLGKGVLGGLRKAGIEPLAFADNRVASADARMMGLPVLSAAEAVERYGKTACFVVTIYQGAAVRKQLAELGCEKVAHFAPLFWKYANVFIPQGGIDLPHRLRGRFEAIRSCHAALADEASKQEVREQLLWRAWLDFSVLSPAADGRDTYFPFDLVTPSEQEVFVDCGGFDGDTVLSFSQHWDGKFRHAFTFEPDPANRKALAANVERAEIDSRVTIMPYAVGNTNGRVSFSFSSSAASHISAKETGSAIECRRLDDVEWPMAPTYIKMDIESAEPEALTGAAELLRKHHPVLAVCTYHRSEHLWDIPNLIRSIAPEYNLFLRRYAEECWEGVCYAIPSTRLRRP